jgi:hypothetical protein
MNYRTITIIVLFAVAIALSVIAVKPPTLLGMFCPFCIIPRPPICCDSQVAKVDMPMYQARKLAEAITHNPAQ